MKVTNKIIDSKNLEKSGDIKNTKKADIKKNIKTDTADKTNEGVKVTLSDKAKEFKTIKAAVKDTPDIDKAKVDRIKAALKDGKFDVNYEKLAQRIVEHDIMYDLLS